MITVPPISAENIDDNTLKEDITDDDNIDLGFEEVNSISESLSKSSNDYNCELADGNSNSSQYFDEASKELIDRIERANNGDTILIEPGIYKIHGINITRNISFQRKANPREVIIDGEELSSIFFINNINILLNLII